jgi:nucleotide-binding universal stress UspA family protein
VSSERKPIVVVGVDGSTGSVAAIRWAARYAAAVGAELRAVLAWQAPIVVGRPAELAGIDYEAAAWRTLRGALCIGLPDRCQLDVDEEVVHGDATRVLLKAARQADLLVVGGSGHGEFAGLLLGSVSLSCVTQAHCPVVVVRT